MRACPSDRRWIVQHWLLRPRARPQRLGRLRCPAAAGPSRRGRAATVLELSMGGRSLRVGWPAVHLGRRLLDRGPARYGVRAAPMGATRNRLRVRRRGLAQPSGRHRRTGAATARISGGPTPTRTGDRSAASTGAGRRATPRSRRATPRLGERAASRCSGRASSSSRHSHRAAAIAARVGRRSALTRTRIGRRSALARTRHGRRSAASLLRGSDSPASGRFSRRPGTRQRGRPSALRLAIRQR